MTIKKKMISAFCNDALATMDGVALAKEIESGEICTLEAIEASIARAQSVNPDLNAIVTETFDLAMMQARENLSGSFAGVPTFIKDNEDIIGSPTLFGSCAVRSDKKKKSSQFVEQFLSMGVVCLGKSTMPEFALTVTTEPVLSGLTHNPWNSDYSTGGSSGGAAALVASGVVPIAHSNDGGGSTRIPASCCGLVGLKPTRGRLKIASKSWLLPVNIGYQGIVSRTVRDTATFYSGAEKYYRNKKIPEIGLVNHPGKKRLNIGIITETPYKTTCHPETYDLALKAGALCEKLGHTVREIRYPFDAGITDDFLIYWGMMSYALSTFGSFFIGRGFDRNNVENWTAGLNRFFKSNIFKIPGIIKRLRGFEKIYNDIFNSYDILLSPTLSHPPPELGYIGPLIPFDEHFERITKYVAFTPIQNISGAPAISLPMGFSSNGLPMGIQFAAAWGREKLLLELAFELEEAEPWPLIGMVSM
ncbi:MAG: amidase [bacterium]|nr:amidase [bacterium]